MALRMGLKWAGKDTYEGFYDQAATLLNIFQTLALLEVYLIFSLVTCLDL